MCGIAGIIRFDGKAVTPESLEAMSRRIRHRGPDGNGSRTFGAAGLAHRRLSIIDLSRGAQPLGNEDKTVWVTFNGEIYNFQDLIEKLTERGHRFQTKSDTEVLVHAYEEWGRECVHQLRGMFAFAIWDERRQSMFLARDRVGIKPLFYFRGPGVFAFASEIQALEALPEFTGDIDLQALDLYLHLQYVPAPFSIYRDVRKLSPGEFLEVKPDGAIHGPVKYWSLRLQTESGLSEQEWLERLDAALRESIRLHLAADVPVGAFLSGGVDSSLVTAYMAEISSQPVRTFSVTFDNPQFDEGEYARQAVQRLHTQHFEERVRPDALSILPSLVRHYGEPFADSSAIPTWFLSRLAAQHVKCVLSGDGGDENFAGYSSYASILWQHRPPRGAYRRTRHQVAGWLRRTGMKQPARSPDDTWYEDIAYFRSHQRLRLWRREFRGLLQGTRAWFDDQMRNAPAARGCSRFQHFDIHNFLPHDILSKVDVASMSHGLEVRVPLLDHVFMELAARLPESLKLHAGGENQQLENRAQAAPFEMTGKYALKRLAERHFPASFVHRRKQGFAIPVGEWFATGLRERVEERLSDPDTQLVEYFDPSFIRELVDEHARGVDHGWRLWSLLFLTEWLDQRSPPGWTGRPQSQPVVVAH
jgi:asparagine synthase (glutamine-hydrolysing)